MATEARIRSGTGPNAPCLSVTLLPRTPEAFGGRLALKCRTEGARDVLEIIEGCEYRYEWSGVPEGVDVIAEPEELFQPDSFRGVTGRLRPGLATGVVDASLRTADKVLGRVEVDVHSRKLSYLSEYQWMLRDIADQMTELVMDRFAASSTRFRLDESRDASTLYQRFAFLKALFLSERFQTAIREVERRPHTAWIVERHPIPASGGLRGDSNVQRQLARAGSRVAWVGGPLPSVPAILERTRTEATHDTGPNRFVKYALEHWALTLSQIAEGLARAEQSPSVSRGRREVSQLAGELEQLLHAELFRSIGRMNRFPAGDQVLHKREGYRDIFRAYIEFELAAALSWSSSDAFSAGQRDVATLYEYWAFIQLSRVVAEACGQRFDVGPLVEATSDKLNVALREGVETVLTGEITRNNRRMLVELWFNRTFGASGRAFSSWTRPMRPDYSLIISAPRDERASFEPVVLHFDAKYRVAFLEDLFGQASDAPDDAGDLMERRGGALRSDLLKMHSYRDAIKRTAGAYILYPGGDSEIDKVPFREYHELLPGLGAFVLRPGEEGEPSGVSALRRFIEHVLDHVSTRLTRHERGRYWVQEAYGEQHLGLLGAGDLATSPDIPVLVGFVKDQAHWQWIERQQVYNVRAEGRPGGVRSDSVLMRSQFILLYSPSSGKVSTARIISAPELMSPAAMSKIGYLNPQGDYWCVQLGHIPDPPWLVQLSANAVEKCLRERGFLRGEPATMTWGDISALLAPA